MSLNRHFRTTDQTD